MSAEKKPRSEARKVWFAPAGTELIGDDVLRRPLFADDNGITTGIDVTPLFGEWTLMPWQANIAGLHITEEGKGHDH